MEPRSAGSTATAQVFLLLDGAGNLNDGGNIFEAVVTDGQLPGYGKILQRCRDGLPTLQDTRDTSGDHASQTWVVAAAAETARSQVVKRHHLALGL